MIAAYCLGPALVRLWRARALVGASPCGHEGYVVVIPDSFQPRGFPAGVCRLCFARHRAGKPGLVPLAQHRWLYAAPASSRALPYVDGRHVGVMGGSHGGSSTLATLVAHEDPVLAAARRDEQFAARHCSLDPGCWRGLRPALAGAAPGGRSWSGSSTMSADLSAASRRCSSSLAPRMHWTTGRALPAVLAERYRLPPRAIR